jgi:glucose-6-phosphate isomerase
MNKNIEHFPRKTVLTPQQKLAQLMDQHEAVHLNELFEM